MFNIMLDNSPQDAVVCQFSQLESTGLFHQSRSDLCGPIYDIPLHYRISKIFYSKYGIVCLSDIGFLYIIRTPHSPLEPVGVPNEMTNIPLDALATDEVTGLVCLRSKQTSKLYIISFLADADNNEFLLPVSNSTVSTSILSEPSFRSVESRGNSNSKRSFSAPDHTTKKPKSYIRSNNFDTSARAKSLKSRDLLLLLGIEPEYQRRDKSRDSLSVGKFPPIEKSLSTSVKLQPHSELSLQVEGVNYTNHDLSVQFSGNVRDLGGFQLHVLDQITGNLVSYQIELNESAVVKPLRALFGVERVESVFSLRIPLQNFFLPQDEIRKTTELHVAAILVSYSLELSCHSILVIGSQRYVVGDILNYFGDLKIFDVIGSKWIVSQRRNVSWEITDFRLHRYHFAVENSFDFRSYDAAVYGIVASLFENDESKVCEGVLSVWLMGMIEQIDPARIIKLILDSRTPSSVLRLCQSPRFTENYMRLVADVIESIKNSNRKIIVDAVFDLALSAELRANIAHASGNESASLVDCQPLSDVKYELSRLATELILRKHHQLFLSQDQEACEHLLVKGQLSSSRLIRFLSKLINRLILSDTSSSEPIRSGMESFEKQAYDMVTIWNDEASSTPSSFLYYLPDEFQEYMEMCFLITRINPNASWSKDLLRFLNRFDLIDCSYYQSASIRSSPSKTDNKQGDVDGLSPLIIESRHRFPEDERFQEVTRLLRSSAPMLLKADRLAEVSDLEFRRKLQLRLTQICKRTLSFPIGRGVLTLGTYLPAAAEPIPCPRIVMSGRIHSTNTIISSDASSVTPEFTLWPFFHNGVASGLRIGNRVGRTPKLNRLRSVTRNWIMYNKTCSHAQSEETSHAGVLFALGLIGHLTTLSHSDICDYLTQGHTPTSVAVLLGCAASYQGTANPFISKTLCLHLPSLLQPRHVDIEIPSIVQAAAIAGLGLLYCRSKHRLISEFLLGELSQIPTSDRIETRESMALLSGWSLGMVLLRAKKSDCSLIGKIDDRLQLLIDGGQRVGQEGSLSFHGSWLESRSYVSTKTSRVVERKDIVNTDATAPGAIVALALMYLRSNSIDIADRLKVPELVYELEETRSDLFLFRSVGRCLILWDQTVPTETWIISQIPNVIQQTMKASNTSKIPPPFIDVNISETEGKNFTLLSLSPMAAHMAYLSVVSGLCLGIGLTHAGTDDPAAKGLTLKFLTYLKGLREAKATYLADQARCESKLIRPLIDLCIGVVALACSAISAGSGDLQVLRILRELRWKVDDVTYGTHSAISMSLGLLFLEGGQASLRRDDFSIACLLLAFLPRFPSRPSDNQFTLQPTRHFYVFAVEHRLLRAQNVDTGEQLQLPVEVEMQAGEMRTMTTPCLLPEIAIVKAVHYNSTSYEQSDDFPYYSASMNITSNESFGSDLRPLLVKTRARAQFPGTITAMKTSETNRSNATHMREIIARLDYERITHHVRSFKSFKEQYSN